MKLNEKQTQAVLESFERNIEKAIANGEKLTWQSFLTNVNGFINVETKKNFIGRFNGLMLSITSMAYGGDTRFASFGQIKKLGGSVLKEEKGTPLFRPNVQHFTDEKTGENKKKLVGFIQYMTYSVRQTNLIEKGIIPEKATESVNEDIAPIDAIEEFAQWIEYDEETSLGCPYYSPMSDRVGMPDFDCFHNAHAHAAGLLHELVHWTGYKTRLNRLSPGWRNEKSYSREELVAELGAAFLLNHLGVPPNEEQEKNHTAYLRGWLKPLKNDLSMLLDASQDAIAACKYLIKEHDRGRKERTGRVRITA